MYNGIFLESEKTNINSKSNGEDTEINLFWFVESCKKLSHDPFTVSELFHKFKATSQKHNCQLSVKFP